MKVAGEEGDANQETLSSLDEHSRQLLKSYELRNVWNIEETGQFWRALPDKSASECSNAVAVAKTQKRGLPGTFFVRASSKKEAPIVVGKSYNPHCFKSLTESSHPNKCGYFSCCKA